MLSLAIAENEKVYEARNKAFLKARLRRRRKLKKYLEEKFKRTYRNLPQNQVPNSVISSPDIGEPASVIQNEYAPKLLRRLSSIGTMAGGDFSGEGGHTLPPIGPPPLIKPSLPSEKLGLARTVSNASDQQTSPSKAQSTLMRDRRRSKAFLDMPEELQAIIASHNTDVAAELARLQFERTGSMLSEGDMEDPDALLKSGLDEMVERLPYGIHFKQYGVADVDLERSNTTCSLEESEASHVDGLKTPIERRILEHNELSVESNELPNNQLKLIIIGHHTSSMHELTGLLTTAVSTLSDRCHTIGMQLAVFNSFWGNLNELAPEEQAYQQLENLKKFLKPDGSLVVILMLVSDKYGQCLLPQRLTKATYQQMFNTAKETHERGLEQLAALARQQKEKEQNPNAEKQEGPKMSQTEQWKAKLRMLRRKNDPRRRGKYDEEDESQAKIKFRKTVRNVQNTSLLLKSVMKDFDPYKSDPSPLPKWYAQKPYSTNTDYHLISHKIRFPKLREDDCAEYLEERGRLEYLIRKFSQNPEFLTKSGFASEVMYCLEHVNNAEMFASIRRFVDFSVNDREAVVKFANYNCRKPTVPPELDAEANSQMEKLLNFVKLKFPPDRQITSAVRWSSNGINPMVSYEHKAYVDKVVLDAVAQVTDCLSRFIGGLTLFRWASSLSMTNVTGGATSSQSPNKPPPELIDDVAIHLNALQTQLKLWTYDYSDQLNSTMSLIGRNQYIFVSGESGSGKSVLMAKIASEIRTELRSKRCNPIVIYRQIGLTHRSLNVRVLLCDLKKQLDHMFFAKMPPPPTSKLPFDTSYLGIENELEKTLALASKRRPFFIVLDGILRLLDFYNGQNLKWLSQNRNEHVHIVMSLATQEEAALEAVKAALSNKSISVGFYRMKPLPLEIVRQHMEKQLVKSETVIGTIIDEYLAAYARSLNRKEAQIESFLLLDLICRKIATGCLDVEELPTSLSAAIGSVLKDAENVLGELVIRRAAGYLATCRIGLTRSELADLLTQDSSISVHLRHALELPMFLTPPSIVSSLIDIFFEPFLTIRKCQNWPLLVFNHVAVRQAVLERYVSARDTPSFGRELTDYFLSTCANQPRYVETIRRYERVNVCNQPVTFVPDPKWHLNGAVECPNIRRIDELPFAVMLAGQKAISVDAAKGDCYLNYDFILAACKAHGLPYILDIFQWVDDHRSEPDEEIALVYESLKMSRAVLQRDISQLGSQILARLTGPVIRDAPLAPGDPPRLLNIRNLLRAIATHRSISSLVPSGSALMLPTKVMNYELNGGHRLPLTAMAVSDDSAFLLTSSQDDKTILWDLRIGGRIIRIIHNIGEKVISLHFARNNEIAIVDEPQRLSAWNLATAELISVMISDNVDPVVISLFKNGSMLCQGFKTSSKIHIWNLLADSSLSKSQLTIDLSDHLDDFLKSSTSSLIMPTNTAPDGLILVTALRTNFAIAWNVDSNKLGQKLRIANKFGSIQAVGRSEDAFAVAYMAYEETNRGIISIIDVFLASDKYQLLHTIHGCRFDEIDKFYINSTGTHALAMFKNYATNTSHFMFWNLDTEDHKHLASHNGITDVVAMTSLNAICTSDRRNPRILIWNLGSEVTKRVPKFRPKRYVAEIQRMQNFSQYVVTRTSHNGPITVWNCLLGRCAGKSVRIEHGVTGESTDVLLIRNTRLLVLTEVKSVPGLSPEAPARTQIFSAFRLYDIVRRSLIRRVSDTLVPVGSSDDFIYYDVNRFMGLSESRTEFIVWEVETGFQVMRIKPSFDSLLELLDPLSSKMRGRRPNSGPRIPSPQRRFLNHLQNEHRNSIYEFLVSEDMSTIVTSQYGHFLCVIDCSSSWFRHTHTLTEPDSLLLLTVSALSPDGIYLVTYSYDELVKMPYVSVWNTRDGQRIRRMTGQRDVGALAVSKDLDLVLIGKENGEMRVWQPKLHHSERIIAGYPGCSFQAGRSRISISEDYMIAFCMTAEISAWDIMKGVVLAVFTSDVSIQCMNVALGGKMAVFGTSESANLITLKLSTLNYAELSATGSEVFSSNVFGELRDPVEGDDEKEDD